VTKNNETADQKQHRCCEETDAAVSYGCHSRQVYLLALGHPSLLSCAGLNSARPPDILCGQRAAVDALLSACSKACSLHCVQ